LLASRFRHSIGLCGLTVLRRVGIIPWLAAGWLGATDLNGDDEACRRCHPAEVRTFRGTGMGRSILPSPDLSRDATVPGPGGISYRAVVRDSRLYQESIRGDFVVESHRILFGIGSGEHGTSYVVSRGDSLFLAPLSYYRQNGGWDLSPGYAAGFYRDFLRPVTTSCLFCHAALPQRQPISCERCHGASEAHAKEPKRAILNPVELSPQRRDDVCYQCHLAGDIRILKPGRTESDFRPGMALQDIVAVYSLPPATRPEGLDAVGHGAQLRMSRCWKESQGRLGCTTFHDPHAQRPLAVAWYRSRCQECHVRRPCTASARRRNATSPPENCVWCHMPKNPLNRIPHVAHTNHRILRRAEEALNPLTDAAVSFDLICETGSEPDLRSQALAYGEAAQGLPQFNARAARLLQAALKADPRDPELTARFGLLRRETASLERAVELGSQSAEVRLVLCELKQAARYCEEAIQLTPYDPAPYLRLIDSYLRTGDRRNAAVVLDRLLEFDPANPQLSDLTQRIEGAK